jgi:glycerophosphoryl diester phosphodiesterase
VPPDPVIETSGLAAGARRVRLRWGRGPRVGWLVAAPVIVLALVLCALLVLSLVWPAIAAPRMLIFAHHGDLDHWPENTLEGIVAASETAIDGVEFDVQRSADGTWWLLHDPVLDSSTEETGVPSTLTDEELASLTIDGGVGFAGQTGLHLPRFDEVLGALADYRGLVMVDVKDSDAAATASVARILVDTGRPDSFVICRSVEAATAVKQVDPGFITVVLTNETWHPDVDATLLDAAGGVWWPRTAWADAGGLVGMYANTRDIAQSEIPLLENGRRWGVSFVITNHIDEALEWAGR